MEMKLNSPGDEQEVAKAKAESWFKPKNGSVFPKKKRLVKTMMFDYLVHSVTLLCSSCFSATPLQPNNACGCKEIFSTKKVANAG